MTYNSAWRWRPPKIGPGPAVIHGNTWQGPFQLHRAVGRGGSFHNEVQGPAQGRGKRPLGPTPAKLGGLGKPPLKRQKKPGTCHLFNKAPVGCPYGRDCMFTHRCSNVGGPWSTVVPHATSSTREASPPPSPVNAYLNV